MPNRLASETSPYLLQHADNPVDWYPWGDEALARARSQDRPILLSIGYSACHWCHVMAHESFEDPAVAALMNESFVNVKVDREERPDLDQIYQAAHAMLSRRGGGWPLTVFLTPDQVPFFAGTYFPPTARHGLPGFPDLLVRIAQAYREQGAAIGEQNARLREALASINPQRSGGVELDAAPLAAAIDALASAFDPLDGGFGRAPKFPHTPDLALCLRTYLRTGDEQSMRMARITLERMAEGGIFDHLGGGFCRYSVDARWTIPHFEKMLYDNAQLLPLYADAWRVTGEECFAEAARATAAWALGEMQTAEGGFCSSIDADSEGEEGRFYLWTPQEVRSTLDEREYAVVAPHFGLDQPPNFEGHAWNLRVVAPLATVASRLSLPLADARAALESARAKLAARRALRTAPGRDDKVLTSWNALMAGGLAHAARVMGEAQWLASARRGLDFLHARLWQNERLLATWKDARARLPAYLDDYAFTLAALLEAMQAGLRERDFRWATELAEALLAHFEDPVDGGFFFTAHDHERLIHRTKSGHDDATPSGNAVAARALIELGHLAGNGRYLAAAERTLELFAPQFATHPSGFASMLAALEEHLMPPIAVLLRGDPAVTARWARELATEPAPARLVLDLSVDDLPKALERPLAGSGTMAWICPGTRCLPPESDWDRLRGTLAGEEHRRRRSTDSSETPL